MKNKTMIVAFAVSIIVGALLPIIGAYYYTTMLTPTPTPTPTQTPTPTPSPSSTPTEASVYIISHRSYFDYLLTENFLIFGEVENNGTENLHFVRFKVKLYDEA